MGLLKSLFGPSREEMWRQVATKVGASYVEGGLFGADKVVAQTGEWLVVLETYTTSDGKNSQTNTRMSAPYLNAEGLSFRIYRETIFTPLGKLFGLKDIEVGDPAFDDQFVIKSNSPARIKELLASPLIKRLMAMQPAFSLQVSDDEGFFGQDYGPAVDRLVFEVPGVVKDPHLLEGLFTLFAELLDEVCARGSAYQDRQPLPANPLPAGTSSSLQEMYAVMTHATRELYGRAERVGDAIEARLVIDRPRELRARLLVTEPRLPHDTATVSLEAQLPGSADLDDLEERLREQTRRRGRIINRTDAGFEVKVTEVPRADVAGLLGVLVEGWRAAVRTAE